MPVTGVVLLIALAVAAWTDFHRRLIPNAVVYPALIVCLAATFWQAGLEGLVASVGGLTVCGGLGVVAWRCASLGGGDVKLLALIGAALGWAGGLNVLLWMWAIAGAVMLGAVVRSKLRSTDATGLESRPTSLAPCALAAVVLAMWSG